MNRWIFTMITLCSMLLPARAEAQSISEITRPVVSEIVSENIIDQRHFTGIIIARSQIELAFQISGTLLERDVNVGDVISKGQTLGRLTKGTLADEVISAKAAVTQAEVMYDIASASLKRVIILVDRGVAAKSRLEAARSAEAASLAGLQIAKAGLVRALDAASFTELKSPSDGTIISVNAEPGTVVTPGTTILTLATAQGKDAVIDVPETYARFLKSGDTFEIALRFGDINPITGTLRLIEPVADTSTRSRRVHLALQKEPQVFRIGSLIKATSIAINNKILSLPKTAFVNEDDQTFVWRITPAERTLERVEVKTQETLSNERVLVSSGISVGDEILIKGVNSVSVGRKVGEHKEK